MTRVTKMSSENRLRKMNGMLSALRVGVNLVDTPASLASRFSSVGELEQQNPITYTCLVFASRNLKSHLLPVGTDGGIRGFITIIIAEESEPSVVPSCPVQLQFPDVNEMVAFIILKIALDGRVFAVREDSFRFIINLGRVCIVDDISVLRLTPITSDSFSGW